jgi:hypothetical protein
MAAQIKFFNKNKLDIDNVDVNITVTDAVATDDGEALLDLMRNRNNASAWITTGSTDAANTTLVFDMVDERPVSDIIIVKHNLKAFTVKYWDGAVYQDFSTAISETVNTEETSYYSFTEVQTSKLQLIITGTQTVDDDKTIRQFIATDKLLTGQLVGWPIIKSPRHNSSKQINKMLSGKVNVVESVGAFSFSLTVSNWTKDADLNIVEEIYFGRKGVLVSLSGGDDAQFTNRRIGYRKEDIYLMRTVNDYSPEWSKGIYTNGLKINMKLAESID